VAYPSTQDLLIFVGIPLAVVGIIFALVYASGGRGAKRYRPGRPYPFAPVWFLARPEKDGPAGRPALASGHGNDSGHASERAELVAAGAEADDALTASDSSVATVASVGAAVAAREHPGVTGGASDRW
jgi:hypothetical protein